MILNEISIRRTRDYILKNYPVLIGRMNQENLISRKKLENINYQLDETYNWNV